MMMMMTASKMTASKDDDSSAAFVPFKLPFLHLRDREQQLDFLLLAWALLLHRRSVDLIESESGSGDPEPAFTYGSNGHPSPILPAAVPLSDAISGDDDPVSKTLEAIRTIRQRRSARNRGQSASGDDGQGMFFATAGLASEHTPRGIFFVEAQVSEEYLALRPSSPTHTISHQMATVHIHAFVDILQSVWLDQDQTVAQAAQVGPRELTHIWQWNATVPPTIERCMHEIFAEKATKSPQSLAVVSWDGEFTYGELDRLSTHLALCLSAHGVSLGTAVPVCSEKSKWTIVAVLAVMKSGGVLVLTDPQQPEARLRTIATEVDAQLVVTSVRQADLGSRIAPVARVVVVGPELWHDMEKLPSSPLHPVPPSATMYIVFTSGSTGKPKGVVISHANYTSGALPRAEAVGYRTHSRVLDFPSYAFDVSVDCMLCTLSHGGCICVPSDEARVNDLSGAIRSMKVNMAHMTPSVARVLETDIMPSLEVLGLGGEPLSAGDASSWSQKTKIVNAYGPSECTVGCTINNNVGGGRLYTSLGKGVGAVTWVVDPADHDSLTPIGAIGELLIEGPIVGQGYLNDQEKTSLAFIEDPVWLLAGAEETSGRHGRLYKTGDLVRYDPDGSGCIIFVGRKDRQVKLRGQRVELAEIEHHLRSRLPSGTTIAAEVITPGGKGSEPTLVAFIAERSDKQPRINGETAFFSVELRKTLAEIDESLAAELPSYMVPTAFIPLWNIPMTVSSKTDRKQLHEIGLAISKKQLASFRAGVVDKHEPKTEIERAIHQLWKRILGGDVEIGLDDNYFALGGDSLKAMKLVAAARAEGLALTVADILTHPKLSDMSLVTGRVGKDVPLEVPPFSLLGPCWDADAARSAAAKLCRIDTSLIEDMYPCAPLQEGLMALSAKVKEAYVAQRVVELADIPTANKLQAAFECVVADCPILRTRIVQIPSHGLMQVVVNQRISWHSDNNLKQYLSRDRDSHMELGEPLSRFAIITDEQTGKIHLVLTIHHALYDGWSMPLIVERINRAYRGLEAQHPTPFNAFIKYLNSVDRTASETYWREQLQGATGLQFPVLPQSGYEPVAESLLEHYVSFARPSNSIITIANAIRGAWALVAAQYTASDDVVFGETLTGRNAPLAGVERIEGPMITTVPVRIRIDRSAHVSDYLQDIHDQVVHRIPHEHVGLQHIRRLSPDAREVCELRTGLVLHPVTEDDKVDDGEERPANGFVPAGDAEAAREALKFNSYALMLVCSLDSRGFLIMASFDSKVVDVPQMDTILAQLGRTVQLLCADTSKLVVDLDFLSAQDRTDIWRVSCLGARPIASSDNDILGESNRDATAMWIVDPADPEHLLPIGAVGELLIEGPIEGPIESSASSIDDPQWLIAGYKDSPGQKTRLRKTGSLAKYNSDGSIVFIDRKERKDRPQAGIEQRQDLRKRLPIRTSRERTLLQRWSRVLGIGEDEIALSDSFFELGGDSIGAMKLVSEIRMDGLQLSVAQVFRHRRFCDMVKTLEYTQPSRVSPERFTPFSALDIWDPDALVSRAILPALAQPTWKITDVLPVRPLQEIAVRGTVQLPRYSARYELFYLDGAVDRTRLFNSCQQLVSHNEILRTVFVECDGRCFGVVLEELNLPVVEYEIEGDLEAFSQKLCELDVQTKMSLGAPFVKFLFVQCGQGRSCLILRLSHAQYDEICLPILLRQLSALYEGRPVAEAIPFSSFVYHVVRENIPSSISYWRGLLHGSSMTVLRPDIVLQSKKVVACSRDFDISARSKDITIATLPTAAWALCLARRLSVRDVTFGEVVSGRNLDLANCDTVMGPCWQYIPVRVKFEPGWSALDLLHFVQDQHIASTRFEGMGLSEIAKSCTDWAPTVDWFDSVIHQDVEHVEHMAFMSANSRMETIYPHTEPLREWKVQAFQKGENLRIEIVSFESWSDFAASLLDDIGDIMMQFLNKSDSVVFD